MVSKYNFLLDKIHVRNTKKSWGFIKRIASICQIIFGLHYEDILSYSPERFDRYWQRRQVLHKSLRQQQTLTLTSRETDFAVRNLVREGERGGGFVECVNVKEGGGVTTLCVSTGGPRNLDHPRPFRSLLLSSTNGLISLSVPGPTPGQSIWGGTNYQGPLYTKLTLHNE